MKRVGLAVLFAGLSVLPARGQSCVKLPVSSEGQLGCSVALHQTGNQPALALGANLGGGGHTGSVTLCLSETDCKTPPLTPADGQAGDEFGRSVAVDDEWLAVGSPFAKGTGVIYLYHRDGGNLTLSQELTASDAARGDQFGLTLALSGDTLIVGAPNAVGTAGSLSGVVYVFHLEGGIWTQTRKLTADDARPFDNFGFSLAIDGSRVIVGAPFHDGSASNSGAAYVFEGSGSDWRQIARLPASGGGADDEFGSSVAVSGSSVAVGARAADPGGMRDAGAVYIYDGSWREVARFAGEAAGDRFGVSAAMTGNGSQLVVGSLLHGGTGAAYLYERQGSGWVQAGPTLLGEAQGDRFGQAVAADGGAALAAGYLAHGSVGRVCDFPVPTGSADVAITLSAPVSTSPGRTLIENLTVANRGPDAATGVRVAANIPAGLTPVAALLPPGCAIGTGAIDCSLGTDLKAGGKWVVSLAFAVLETCVPVIQSSATVSSNNDPDSSNDGAQALTGVVRRADLAIHPIGPALVKPGALLSYVLTVTNLGPDIACGVVVSDPLPAGSGPTSSALPSDCKLVEGSILCSIRELAAESSQSFAVDLEAPQVVACGGSVVNTATVSAVPPDADPRPLNNSRAVTTAVVADLSITMKVSPAMVGQGDTLTYTIVVKNPGGSSATVTDVFPAGLTSVFWCQDEGKVPCIPYPVGPGGDLDIVLNERTATYRVQATVAPTFLGTALTNTVTVAGPPGCVDTDPSNNLATVITSITPSGVAILCEGIAGNQADGGTAIYNFLLLNRGRTAQSNVMFSDPLPAGLTPVAATASNNTPVTLGNPVTWNGPIPANGAVTITITAMIGSMASGTFCNVPTVAFDQDGDGINESVGAVAAPCCFKVPETVPALSDSALAVLALLMALTALRRLRRRSL